MPKISVIIPVYNAEKYLRECLESVINQTFKDIEIICVNDGSVDNSLEILNKYADKDERIKIISQENRGHSEARNTALKIMSGEYVYFLDSDDYITPTLLEHAINIFNNFDIDYFCFGSKAFCEDECIQSLEGMNEYIRVKRKGLHKLNFDIGLNTNIHVWNKVFKASVIKNNNIFFPSNLIYEDIYFMWYYFFLSKKAYFDEEIFHCYRMRSESTMEIATKFKNFDSGISHMYNWHHLMLSLSKNQELFMNNFDNLLKLLDMYANRTKDMVSDRDKYKVELLNKDYQKEIFSVKNNFMKENARIKDICCDSDYSFLEKIFSVKNSKDRQHKIICCCGVKIKIGKRQRLHNCL